MELNFKNKKVVAITVGAIIVVVVGIVLIKKAKAGPNSKLANVSIPGLGSSSSSKGEKIVTDYDKSWDYKYIDGVWYAAKKGTQDWKNLKSTLPSTNYQTVVDRLKKYL